MTPGSMLHAMMIRDERVAKEVLGLVRPRPGAPIQLGREDRGMDSRPARLKRCDGRGEPPSVGSGRQISRQGGQKGERRSRRQRWSLRSLFAR